MREADLGLESRRFYSVTDNGADSTWASTFIHDQNALLSDPGAAGGDIGVCIFGGAARANEDVVYDEASAIVAAPACSLTHICVVRLRWYVRVCCYFL